MKIRNKKLKKKKYLLIRMRYGEKRHTDKWKLRKKRNYLTIQRKKAKEKKQRRKPPIKMEAPKNFSLIKNTNNVLSYFKDAEALLKKKENVTLDISKVDSLTPDAVALMVASINDVDFIHDSVIVGNAPNRPEPYKLFTESGFYDYVKSKGSFASKNHELLHKEVNRIVVSSIAKDASLVGIRHVFGNEIPFEPLYEILIECMSNTKSHADLHAQGKCNWWLYVHNVPNEKVTSYSFLDLGVGIFKSTVLQNYFKNQLKGTVLYKNINLVDDLLAGKIQSRIDIDNEIRGKGIPQIVQHASIKSFKSFYIISNDVKINLKSGGREQLEYDLKGTFLYWELNN